MLQEFIREKHVTCNAMVGIYPANTVGDDIEVYEDESRATVRCKFHGLRQQSEKDDKSDPCAPSLASALATPTPLLRAPHLVALPGCLIWCSAMPWLCNLLRLHCSGRRGGFLMPEPHQSDTLTCVSCSSGTV